MTTIDTETVELDVTHEAGTVRIDLVGQCASHIGLTEAGARGLAHILTVHADAAAAEAAAEPL